MGKSSAQRPDHSLRLPRAVCCQKRNEIALINNLCDHLARGLFQFNLSAGRIGYEKKSQDGNQEKHEVIFVSIVRLNSP